MAPLASLVAFIALAAAPPSNGAPGPIPPAAREDRVLQTLRRTHPRLIVTDADMERTRRLIGSNPQAAQLHEQLRRTAERMLDAPVVQYKLIGPRLLSESRGALSRIYALAAMYRLDGDVRFAERARKEALAAAALPDWHPAHFLDTAEMCHAVAIAYDWLYSYLSPEDRETLRRAIVQKGLEPSLDPKASHNWWLKVDHNWNQVCHGGMAIGALAIADEEPRLAARIVSRAVDDVRLAMAQYAPDGGWAEGPGYWHYATEYNVYLLAALQTALGTTFGLTDMPGFRDAGWFRVQFVGPTNRTFNYADAGDGAGSAPEMLWLARQFRKPLYAWHERQHLGRDPLDLLWYSPDGSGPKADGAPLDALFKGINVAFFRSAWEDPQALFLGFKGGDNKANHSHLDLGTFVLDALGQRWALDLGGDDYNLPGYFGRERWTYYRLRTEGHNTLTLNGANQSPQAAAPIVAFHSDPKRAFAVADLTAAYQPTANRAMRGVALLDRRNVLVQDEVEGAPDADVTWTMHTRANVQLDGPTATLTLGGEKLVCRVLQPSGAKFEVLPADPPPPQAQQPDVKRLVVRVKGSEAGRIAVLLCPRSLPEAMPAITPLADWGRS